MRIIFVFILGLISGNSFGQENVKPNKSLYIKGNIATMLITMPNIGLEYQLSPKHTLQGDIFISPWKSIRGNHAQVYMGHIEGRYYFKEAFNGWYIGANAGLSVFDIAKWNYLNTGKYQRGFNYMLGGVIGYQYQWKERWNLDFFIGGGTSQGFYHGYKKDENGEIIRYEEAPGRNRSGEWTPYRGGVMISYKLK